MTLNFPNIYSLGQMSDYDSLAKPAIMTTMMIFIAVAIFCYHRREYFDKCNTVSVCAWIICTCCMFLPAIHERYDYAVILLVTVCVLAVGDYRNIWLVIVINLCDTLTYSSYLFGAQIDFTMVSLVYCGSYFVGTYVVMSNLSRRAIAEN